MVCVFAMQHVYNTTRYFTSLSAGHKAQRVQMLILKFKSRSIFGTNEEF